MAMRRGRFSCLVPEISKDSPLSNGDTRYILTIQNKEGFCIENEDDWKKFIGDVMKWDEGLEAPSGFPVVCCVVQDFVGGEIINTFDCYEMC
jgi:hypothetical protein